MPLIKFYNASNTTSRSKITIITFMLDQAISDLIEISTYKLFRLVSNEEKRATGL